MTRMTRVVLAAALAAAAPACGSKESSAPAAEPGAVAGDVLEVTGTVTARRGDAAPRPLKVGDTVAGDEIVETGADGSVVIELRHNRARWSLSASQSKKVSESAAWKAPRRDDGVAMTEEQSTAAGRHAERESAGTAVSATEAAPAPAAAAAPPEPAAAPAPAPASDRRVATKRPGGGAPADLPKREMDVLDEPSGGGGPPPPPPPPPADDVKSTEEVRKAKSAPTSGLWSGSLVSDVRIDGPLDAAAASKALSSRKGAYATCWLKSRKTKGPESGTMSVTLTVAADGSVTKVQVTADQTTSLARSCVERQLQGLTFPTADAPTTIEASILFTTDQ